MFAIDTKRLSSSMQAFNLSFTNVSVNSPYYREWQPLLLLISAYLIMASSPESLWRLFAV